jgi:hypothetical protein
MDTRRVILETAAETAADPRTVARVLRGEHVRGHVGDRIRRALADRGIEPRAPQAAQGPERAA